MQEMIQTPPKVSIGLPVYNGERYLAETIQSLRDQIFPDFEIIICDNASTDGTAEICRRYLNLDKRIRYYRNSKNFGAAFNFNRTFKLASGKYFKWAAHDDLIAPDFLLKCVEILDKDLTTVLCHSDVQFIDRNGNHIQNECVPLRKAGSQDPHVRFAEITNMNHWCLDIFGLIRSATLKETPLIASYVGSDRNTLVMLGLLGRFYRIPECLFFTRDHGERSVRKIPINYRAAWFDPTKGNRIAFPHWRIFYEYFKSISRVNISLKHKTLCYLYLAKWFKSNLRLLKKDLKIASNYIADHLFAQKDRKKDFL
jgi:glycosyltransferase involved in cell wall biosynthesis